MKSNFKYGLKVGLLYYLIAVSTTCLSYFVFGDNYEHVPGPYFFIGILFLLVGTGWIVYYLALLLTGYKTKVNFGVLTVHFIVILSIIVTVYIDIKISDIDEYKTNLADVITISTDTASNTSSIVSGNGDTLYSQKGDSVLVDKIKKDTSNSR